MTRDIHRGFACYQSMGSPQGAGGNQSVSESPVSFNNRCLPQGDESHLQGYLLPGSRELYSLVDDDDYSHPEGDLLAVIPKGPRVLERHGDLDLRPGWEGVTCANESGEGSVEECLRVVSMHRS